MEQDKLPHILTALSIHSPCGCQFATSVQCDRGSRAFLGNAVVPLWKLKGWRSGGKKEQHLDLWVAQLFENGHKYIMQNILRSEALNQTKPKLNQKPAQQLS